MNLRIIGAALAAFAIGFGNLQADESRPLLHPLFCDHAVLQRGMPVPVWGWAVPGAKVTVKFAGQTKSAVAGTDGKWMVKLGSLKASGESRTLSVQAGDLSTNLQDVLVGDVWLCSGQSNMEMGIGACEVTNEIAQANYPKLRLLTVPRNVAMQPVQLFKTEWLPCSPTTVTQGLWAGFSAAGYFFGRKVHQETGLPIGLIHSSWGGTPIESWISYESLQPVESMKERLNAYLQSRNNAVAESNYPAVFDSWAQKNDPGSLQGWWKPDTDFSSWKSVEMPQHFEAVGLPGFDGIVWFSREINIPADWAGKELELRLGPIDDIDTTWVNGVRIGQMNRYDLDRVYKVPASAFKAGATVVTVRVLDTGGEGGFSGKSSQMSLAPVDKSAAALSLAGTWRMRDSAPIAKLAGIPPAPDSQSPNTSTVLYNGMIAPLAPFAFAGAIWYQGEANVNRAEQYRQLLPTMVNDWKSRFGLRQLPFYIVQLAAFMPTNDVPRESDWAELREAQAIAARTLKHSGIASAIDIGDAKDIHPKNKMEVGRRLALCALADTYGQRIEYSGPTYRSMKVTDKGISIRFDHATGRLIANGGQLTGFAIAGDDKKFVWADARIEGNTVIVSSPKVAKPVAVRYAWDINPVCNLYNQAGLPAMPFRTDDFPLITHGKN